MLKEFAPPAHPQYLNIKCKCWSVIYQLTSKERIHIKKKYIKYFFNLEVKREAYELRTCIAFLIQVI